VGPEAAEEVPVGRVALERLAAEIDATGSIAARRVTEIAAGVPGRLVRVFVDVGDSVEEGAPLFQIDPGSYEMALAEARAGLALARAESENAAAEAARVQRLVEQHVVSAQRSDQLRTRATVARARVDQMQARVARARHDLAQTLVRAPYAGSVVERRADEGTLAGAAPVIVLQEGGALEAILDVPEAAPVPVRPRDPVVLYAEGQTDPIQSRVERVSRRVDPQTRTYEVRCPVVDPSDGVKAGSYVRAELRPTRREPHPVIDRSALLTRDGRSFVLRLEEGRTRRIAVRTGILTARRAEILAGVAPGDRLVLGEAVRRLPDGARVRAEEAAEQLSSARAEGPP